MVTIFLNEKYFSDHYGKDVIFLVFFG